MPEKTADAGGLLLSLLYSPRSPNCTDAVLCRKAAHNLLISLNFELDVSKNRRTVIFYCQMPHQGVHKASGSDSMRLALGEGFPSGQRDQTVNLTALPSKVRILLPPPFKCKSSDNQEIPRGGVPERPKGSDCKSDGSAFEGSNPSPSTISLIAMAEYNLLCPCGGVPERPKGSDCKSDGSAFEGSNPSPSTIIQENPASRRVFAFCYPPHTFSALSDLTVAIASHLAHRGIIDIRVFTSCLKSGTSMVTPPI